jgi:hypothetical protein
MVRAALVAIAISIPTAAAAQGKSGMGLGAEAMLTGVQGASGVYDTGPWRVEGLLGFLNGGSDIIAVGGRFVYVMHQGTSSDFGVGGGLGLVSLDGPMDNDDETDIHLEVAAHIRAFVTPNVALSAALGIGFILEDEDANDDDTFGIGGQLIGGVGIHYYFW